VPHYSGEQKTVIELLGNSRTEIEDSVVGIAIQGPFFVHFCSMPREAATGIGMYLSSPNPLHIPRDFLYAESSIL
jgi:hypothetical protein